MTKFSILSVASIVAVQSGLACGNNEDNAGAEGAGGNAGTVDNSAGGVTGFAGMTARGSPTPDGGAFVEHAAGLTDPEMLNLLELMSTDEVRQGRVAENKAQNAAVRGFASTMVKEHTIIGYSTAVVASSMGLTPSTSQEASMATRMGEAVMQGMNTMPAGAAFDRWYMDVQIQGHKGELAAIEQMNDSAQAIPLRMLLADTLTALQRHLDEANIIRFSLSE